MSTVPISHFAALNIPPLIANTTGPQRPDWRAMAELIAAGAAEALTHPLDPLAAELDAIAEGLRQSGDHEAADNLAEYGEYDYHGMARILNAYADRIAAIARQLKG